MRLADQGRIDEALALFRPLEDKSQASVTQMISQNYAERDPAAAAAWLGALPEKVPTKEAIDSLFSQWLPRDPEGVARWLESLPVGARRDESIFLFIRNAVVQRNTGVEDWVEQIADPAQRQKAAEWAYWNRSRDPEKAREWIRNLPGVDAAWRESFLKTAR